MSDILRTDAITGKLLHRAWLKSGRADPLLDTDAWDGFALTVQAVAEVERLGDPVEVREAAHFREGVQAAKRALSAAGMHDARCPEPDDPCTCGLDDAVDGALDNAFIRAFG